jgi:hypothetical protein
MSLIVPDLSESVKRDKYVIMQQRKQLILETIRSILSEENEEHPDIERLKDQYNHHNWMADKIFDRGGDSRAAQPHIEAMQILQRHIEIARKKHRQELEAAAPAPTQEFKQQTFGWDS